MKQTSRETTMSIKAIIKTIKPPLLILISFIFTFFASFAVFTMTASTIIALNSSLFTIHAQTQQSAIALSISPTLAEVNVSPGERVTLAFNIINEGNVDLNATPLFVDFLPDEKTGKPIVIPTRSSFPYASLQNQDKALGQPFVFRAGKSDQLVLVLDIPEDATAQDYYQTLVVSTTPTTSELVSTGSHPSANIGVHVLIRITDPTQLDWTSASKLQLDRWTVPAYLDSFSPLVFQLFIKNTGSSYTKASGRIEIVSMTDEILKIFPLLPENILAGNIREVRASITDPENRESAIPVEFRYDPAFLFGFYDINLYLGSEFEQEKLVASHRVLAIPFFALGVIILFLVVTLATRGLTTTLLKSQDNLE